MNQLQRAALARLPLSEADVARIYDCSRSSPVKELIRDLCASHERLRAELQGAELLLAEANAKLAAALALTDTCSEEFRKAFPRIMPPGWQIVERIREVLQS